MELPYARVSVCVSVCVCVNEYAEIPNCENSFHGGAYEKLFGNDVNNE